ncbi:hypothetical protein CFOL_v3_14923 [Cephalotus follicularis]|uniref:Uncharacterized protein n=1 Tax=Cephalotus follicularis TaxID=3775 RepID=A0A1Q3BTZ7_CEPFO|nr:hypothetical protein CFOL_v3_14923 [Cephalotus follicularis]
MPTPSRTKNGLDPEAFLPIHHLVRAYRNTKRDVIGLVTLDCQIRGLQDRVFVHVIDISTSFNLFLGRPWLHKHKAVVLMVHEKIKMKKKGEILTILGEDTRELSVIVCFAQIQTKPLMCLCMMMPKTWRESLFISINTKIQR